MPSARGRFAAQPHHPGGQVAVGQRVLFQIETAGALDSQRMHRQTVRRKTANFIHGMFKLRHFLAGKPRDHVHIDILKPQLPASRKVSSVWAEV